MKAIFVKILNIITPIGGDIERGNYSYHYLFFPIKKNKIVICNHYGKGFGDNGKYIVNAANKMKREYDFVWLVSDEHIDQQDFPKNVRLVKYGGVRCRYELATAKVWIDNCRKIIFTPKRKGQVYIQTWHSPLRLKKIEKDTEESLLPGYIRKAKRDSAVCDYIISGFKFSTKIFSKSFWYDGAIVECGTPRCDIFFTNDKSIKSTVYANFGLKADTNIVLFAPTFRNDNNSDIYQMDYETIISAFEEKFGGEWVMLVRLHPNVVELASQIEYTDKVLNASHAGDMQELLYTCDALITDYSSSMFDMIVAKKKCFLYTPDVLNYLANERKLYFDFDELPFSIAESIDELKNNISNFDNELYVKSLIDFCRKTGSYENGSASNSVVELIDIKTS